MKNYKIKDNILYFGGCSSVELVKKYDTPVQVISQEVLEKKFLEINKKFIEKFENVEAYYASKAFLNLSMCKLIDKAGLGLDVVSGGELFIALKANFPSEKIIFHGNNKSKEELIMAIKNNVKRIVIDNRDELELVEKLSQKLNKKVKVLFRVNPDVEGKTHKYISTGQKDSKFGIPISDNILKHAVKRAVNFKNIQLMGFHFHIGSQLLENTSHLKALDIMFRFIKEIKDDYNFDTLELNTGGGYGIKYRDNNNIPSLEFFTDAIMERVNELTKKYNLIKPKIIIEPGRWIIGEAGITLYTIGSIKDIPNTRKYVSIDGGMTDNPRPALYNSNYEGIIANKANFKPNQKVTISGKCCESGDILIWDLEVPEINTGDILAVFSTGAYNYSMANNYNKLLKPAVVLVKGGEADLIVKRETYKDLISKNVVPKRLEG